MANQETTPADSAAQTSQPHQDWHWARIKAELETRGKTLSGISVERGYSVSAAAKVRDRRWPALQAIIASAIGVPPQEIWPSRYDAAGSPIFTRGERSTRIWARHDQKRGAA